MKRLLLILIAVALLGGAAFIVWVYRDLRSAISHQKSDQYVEIPTGSSPSFVLRKLAAEGIIRREWPLSLYLKLTGKGSTLKAGEYNFPSPISPLGALAK